MISMQKSMQGKQVKRIPLQIHSQSCHKEGTAPIEHQTRLRLRHRSHLSASLQNPLHKKYYNGFM